MWANILVTQLLFGNGIVVTILSKVMGHFVVFSNITLCKEETNMAIASMMTCTICLIWRHMKTLNCRWGNSKMRSHLKSSQVILSFRFKSNYMHGHQLAKFQKVDTHGDRWWQCNQYFSWDPTIFVMFIHYLLRGGDKQWQIGGHELDVVDAVLIACYLSGICCYG